MEIYFSLSIVLTKIIYSNLNIFRRRRVIWIKYRT